jgi:hypothetical protein
VIGMHAGLGRPFTDAEWAARSARLSAGHHPPSCGCVSCLALDAETNRLLAGDSFRDDDRGDIVGHGTNWLDWEI